MNETTTVAAPTATPAYLGLLGRAVLAAGPLGSVYAVLHFQHTRYVAVMPLATLLLVTLLAWSPLPVSIPALMLGDARDWALARFTGPRRVLRAVLLVPYLLRSAASPCRAEMALSLAGFAAAVVAAAPHLV